MHLIGRDAGSAERRLDGSVYILLSRAHPFSEEGGSMGMCCIGNRFGNAPHAPFHIAPSSSLLLQLSHHMVQQYIPRQVKAVRSHTTGWL